MRTGRVAWSIWFYPLDFSITSNRVIIAGLLYSIDECVRAARLTGVEGNDELEGVADELKGCALRLLKMVQISILRTTC